MACVTRNLDGKPCVVQVLANLEVGESSKSSEELQLQKVGVK
jgi:hypothetical protein